MLPALDRRRTAGPPPLTVPFIRLPSVFPDTVTRRSLETLPAEVSASRSKAEFPGHTTVTPPAEDERSTVLVKETGKIAETEPAELEPLISPMTFSIVIPPALLLTRVVP